MAISEDPIVVKFDEVTKELKEIAKSKNLDLSQIKISNKAAERYNRRYGYNNTRFGIPLACYYN